MVRALKQLWAPQNGIFALIAEAKRNLGPFTGKKKKKKQNQESFPFAFKAIFSSERQFVHAHV